MARSALLNVMVQAAFKAGKSLARDFGEVQNLQVSLKGPGDYVSQADRKAEKIIREELMKARPTYGFLGEESEEIVGTDGAEWTARSSSFGASALAIAAHPSALLSASPPPSARSGPGGSPAACPRATSRPSRTCAPRDGS